MKLLAAVGCIGVLMAGCQAEPEVSQKPSRIVIDGFFDDWQDVAVAVSDPVDPSAAFCDFREFKATADENSVFFYLGLQHDLLLTSKGGYYKVLIDIDDQPATGWPEGGMDGVDLVLQGRPVETEGYVIMDRFGVRLWPTGEETAAQETNHREISGNRIGLQVAPSYMSKAFEIRIDRGIEIDQLASPSFAEAAIRVKIAGYVRDQHLIDETEILRLELPPYRPPLGAGDNSDIDPLIRAPDCRLRVVTWNVSHRTIRQRAKQAALVLTAINPDIVLINEMSNQMNPAEVQAMIASLPSGAIHKGWNLVYGEGGGEERSVIASRYPLRPVEDLLHLDYPLGIVDGLPREFDDLDVTESIKTVIDDRISTAGAIVEVDNFRILAVALGMQSKGFRAYGWQEALRKIQAATIRSAVEVAVMRESLQGLIIAGDFNLVVSRIPLDTLRGARDFNPGELAIAGGLQLDGQSNATWRSADSFFLPGRLDYLLYDDTTMRLGRSFAFDSSDLSPEWIEHHGLTAGAVTDVSDHLPIVADFGW
jgi:endonuclease/exonuclease/phosphatase family metal-dependent hydrolase